MSEQLTDRPDKPGLWFRDGEWYMVNDRFARKLLMDHALSISYISSLDKLPAGNWSPAIHASRVAELESELKASKPHALVGKAMIEAFEAIRDAGLADDPPKDECLNAYIETWAKQKARVAELEAEVERLRNLLAELGKASIALDGCKMENAYMIKPALDEVLSEARRLAQGNSLSPTQERTCD